MCNQYQRLLHKPPRTTGAGAGLRLTDNSCGAGARVTEPESITVGDRISRND